MDLSELLNYLDSEENGIEYKTCVHLDTVSTFRIGGDADIGIYPKNKEEFIKSLKKLSRLGIPYIVIGHGSNVLFDDSGYRGAVVFTAKMNAVKITGNTVYAEAGALITALCTAVYGESLTGMEFAYGIPGSVGGAVFMNAGAYGGSISDIIISADVYDPESGLIIKLNKEELHLAYRHSVCMEKSYIILSAGFELAKGAPDEIRGKMDELMGRRREKQPLEYPSAGSVFKRPEGYFAGKLIEDCGLKGYRIGGAQVSEKHAGFIINTGDASSEDVLRLAEHIKNTVYEKFKIMLECEIRHIK